MGSGPVTDAEILQQFGGTAGDPRMAANVAADLRLDYEETLVRLEALRDLGYLRMDQIGQSWQWTVTPAGEQYLQSLTMGEDNP